MVVRKHVGTHGMVGDYSSRHALNDGQEWEEVTDYLPEWDWRRVEREAKGQRGELSKPEDMPTMAGVVFLGLIDGTHQCRPATVDEIWRAPLERSRSLSAKEKQ